MRQGLDGNKPPNSDPWTLQVQRLRAKVALWEERERAIRAMCGEAFDASRAGETPMVPSGAIEQILDTEAFAYECERCGAPVLDADNDKHNRWCK